MPLVVQSNWRTLVVLSFTEGFRTIFQLREKELGKNWTDQQNWAMNLNHIFVKRLRGFWRWRVKKIVCLYSAFKICDLIKATHLQRPEEGSLLKYFEDNNPAGQWSMLILICLDLSSWHWLFKALKPWSGKNCFPGTTWFFSVFSVMFSSVTPSLLHKLISCVSWDGIKDKTQT